MAVFIFLLIILTVMFVYGILGMIFKWEE